MNIPYDNLDFGPVILTYTFKPGQQLPKVGEVMEDERSSMVVTESNSEHNYVKVLLTTTETVASRLERYVKEVEESIKQTAKILYERTTDGMVSLIGWGNLTDETKEPFLELAKDIFIKIDDDGLLILKFGDIEK